MKKVIPRLAAISLLAALLSGCADPNVQGPFFIGQAPTLENAMANRYRPSSAQVVTESEARASTIVEGTEQDPIVVHTPPSRTASGRPIASSGGRSAW